MYKERIDYYNKSHFSINVSDTPILEIVKNFKLSLSRIEFKIIEEQKTIKNEQSHQDRVKKTLRT